MCLVLCGCSLQKHVNESRLQVAHFHGLLNAGNFDEIIAEADPELKWPSRGPSFKDYLAGVHRKLGFCGTWRMLSYNENWSAGGGRVGIRTDTHCDVDNAQESFIFDARTLKLREYAVTSRAFVVS